MPVYRYEMINTEGKVLGSTEIYVPVEDRDAIALRRVEVPDQIRVTGFAPSKEQDFDQKILKGYHQKECREGARFQSQFSKDRIKKAWSSPQPDIKTQTKGISSI